MRQLSQWEFVVVQGEIVSLQIIPIGFDERFVGVELDDLPLINIGDCRFQFSATKSPGNKHLVRCEFDFPDDAPESARCHLTLTGSKGGRFTQVVSKSDATHDPDIIFRIGRVGGKSTDRNVYYKQDDLRGARSGGDLGRPGDKRNRDLDRSTKGGSHSPQRGHTKANPLRSSESEKSIEDVIKGESPLPELFPEIRPEVVTEIAPEIKPEIRPEVVTEIAPEIRPEIRPEVMTEVAPEIFPDIADGLEAISPHRVPRSKPRIVNVGFAREDKPAIQNKRDMPLVCDQSYYFWLEVGRLLKGNIDDEPVNLPTDSLPPDAVLTVVLFPFENELQIKPGADVGELKLLPDGSVVVERNVASPGNLEAGSRLLKRRLFFPVRTPKRDGVFRLRCNIYHKQVLVQSRLISANVMQRPHKVERALHSNLDYTLTRTLSPSHFAGMEQHRLSIMLNDNGDGTHGLRFWGEGNGGATGREFKADATISGQKLEDLIVQARGALRKVSWGDAEQWQDHKAYLYNGPRNFDRLKADLIELAKKGYRFYDGIIGHFTRATSQTADMLADLMLKPGQVQIALKESATLLIPASLLYDYSLDDGISSHKICPAFSRDFKGNVPLEQTDCFNGMCPSRGNRDTVCPSGFWGYRHILGLPLSVAGADDAPTQINWQDAPQLTVAVSTNLEFFKQHEEAIEKQLKARWPALGWNYAETRQLTLQYLKDKKPQLVYFYCHGGLENNAPYIKVGPRKDDKITRSNLRAYGIRWVAPRPLVFINGCHTTAVEPEQALEFVSGFIEVANAAGVIGTEITVFESLAKRFAEDCLQRFILNMQSIGEAVRGARLTLLKDGNPLGLVYIPFVMANLKMSQQ